MKTVAIVNPSSAGGTTSRAWSLLSRGLEEGLKAQVEGRFTRGKGHATLLTREALREGVDCIVCVGGDGSVNEIVNGFFDEEGERVNPEAALAVLPRGTGCDFARTFEFPRDAVECGKSIAAGRRSPCDVGRVQLKGLDGEDVNRYFVNVADFGMGGEVSARVNRSSKLLGGFITFLGYTLMTLFSYRPPRVSVVLDGETIVDEPIYNVFVGNGQYCGGGMWIAPQSSTSDGLFDVVVVRAMSVFAALTNVARLYGGTVAHHPLVSQHRGCVVEAHSDQTVQLEMEGENPGTLPARVEMVPAAITLIHP